MELPLLGSQSTQVLLLWSTIICLAFYHIHQQTATLPVAVRFFLGAFTGFLFVFFCHLSLWRRERIRKKRETYTQQLIALEKEDLFKLLPEHAARTAAAKRPDQVKWMNLELEKVWPFLNEAVSDIVRDQLQPVLEQYKMGVLADMEVQSTSFGIEPPQISGVKMEGMGEDEASIEADLNWRTEKERIVIKVKTIGPDFKVKVKNITVSATAKIVFKPLLDRMPCFGAVLISFVGIPSIDFDLKIADGDANALPGVDKMIDNSIRAAIEDMLVWPSRIVCPVLPGDYSFLELKPVGVLDVSLIRAEGVMNTDILGKSDCFVILYIRKKPERIKRSTTKKNSLHPVWNEGFKIEVDDPKYQKLTVQLMDEESVTSAEYIGQLVPHEPKEVWLDMMESTNLQFKRPRAQLQLVILYEPFDTPFSDTEVQKSAVSSQGDNMKGK
ncbi:hypothetical protein KP509_30G048300 [Ceratopteris richardii]|uniref:Uncharacterized protein n=1 Tax=Ceratopteris richardii TaxID=49495 RepID=A0A8T2R228_CERRI|nr:hypothetical protein KP509_30G048300 [Ceratopteris richardii]